MHSYETSIYKFASLISVARNPEIGERNFASEGGTSKEEGHRVDHVRESDPLNDQDESDAFLKFGVVANILKGSLHIDKGVGHFINNEGWPLVFFGGVYYLLLLLVELCNYL